jgi:hypothetical protein
VGCLPRPGAQLVNGGDPVRSFEPRCHLAVRRKHDLLTNYRQRIVAENQARRSKGTDGHAVGQQIAADGGQSANRSQRYGAVRSANIFISNAPIQCWPVPGLCLVQGWLFDSRDRVPSPRGSCLSPCGSKQALRLRCERFQDCRVVIVRLVHTG